MKEEFSEYVEWIENQPNGVDRDRIIEEMRERFSDVYLLKKKDPKLFEIEKQILKCDIQIMAITKKFKNIKDPETKKAWIDGIRKILQESFEWRQKRRQLEADAIAAELEKIQGFLKKREEHKDEIIQRRLDQLTGDKTLEW